MFTARGVKVTSDDRPPDSRGGRLVRLWTSLTAATTTKLASPEWTTTGLRGYAPTAAVAVLLVVAWVLNLAELSAPWDSAVVGWLPAIGAMIIAALALRRTAGMPSLAPGAARFWQQYVVVIATGTACLAIRAADGVGRTSVEAENDLPLATVVVGCVSVKIAILALLWIPVGRLSRTQWIHLALDTLTILLGAFLVLWYVTLGPLVVDPPSQTSVWGPLAICTLCLIALAATVKIALVGSGPVDMRALWLLGGSLLAGGLSAGTASMISAHSSVVPGQVAVPVVAALVTLAARQQAAAAARGSSQPVRLRRKRPYSRLPYFAVLATDILLVTATLGKLDLRAMVVVYGVILVSAVVAIRQLLAFGDNTRLVDQLRDQEDQLRHQADHDALTRLTNRQFFTQRLDAALAEGPAGRLAVLLIDLDDFKSVNDTLGHAVGDQALISVADRLKQCLRSTDIVARLGGDEFGVLLRGVDPAVADATAARILANLTAPVVAEDYDLLIRASIGVAVAAPDDDSGTLLRNADIAMYAAKERGKGAHLRYVPGMATNVLEHAQLGAQLREAIGAGQLHPVFQPVLHLTEHRILGMETLVRWNHPARGEVLPTEFITTAERTGLIVPMGRWLLGEACGQLAAWKRAYGPHAPATIGVNVSGRQLAEPDFPADIAAAVERAGLDPHNLVLEVTEDAVLTGEHAIDTLRALHEYGVMIALDDFGTGQSSLGLLRTCPVDILKLDKSFVEGIAEGTQQSAIATAVVKMAQALGLDAVAEGIENDAQIEFMLSIEYYLGQGFYLAPPMPADEVARLFGQPTVTARRNGFNGARPAVPADVVPVVTYGRPAARGGR